MAILVKNSMNGLGAMKAAGVSPLLTDQFIAAGGEVKLTASEFDLSVGIHHVSIPVNLDTLQKLKGGTMPTIEKVKLANTLVKAITDLSAAVDGNAAALMGHGTMSTLPKAFSKPLVSPTKELTQLDELSKALGQDLSKPAPVLNYGIQSDNAAKMLEALAKAKTTKQVVSLDLESSGGGGYSMDASSAGGGGAGGGGMGVWTGGVTDMPPMMNVGGWTNFPKSKMKSATPVKLRDATAMYQPVYGTSSGSRYWVVAANQDIRIAAKLDAGTLSVRIEGPNLKKHVNSIQETGFTDKSTEGYASMHLNVGSDLAVARKTLGAILMGLGISMETAMPNIDVIAS